MDSTYLTKLQIQRGAIFHSKNINNITHGKFFVVVGQDEENIVGFFFINSKIDNSIIANKSFFDMQMPIKKENYPFLDYLSYIDCHEIKKIRKEDFCERIESNDIEYKTILIEEDLRLMMEAVRESIVFSTIEKNNFFK
jgi:disulfide oxidoreductase YuzD